MKWYHWIYIFGAGLLAVAAFAFGRRVDVRKMLGLEIEVIDAKAATKKIQNEQDHAAALRYAEEKYKKEINDLDEEEKRLADSFRDDPSRLVEFAVRTARAK